MCAFADNDIRRLGLGMPPQVPSDAHDVSKAEEPVVAAAALGWVSQDSRHVQTDSEVPELCALIVCCFALRACHRVLSDLQVDAAVGSTGNLPPPTCQANTTSP